MNTSIIMQKVAQVSPHVVLFMTKTAEEVRESPFGLEIVSELDTLIKKATASGMMGTMGRAAVGLGGVALSGVAISLAGDMYDSLRRGITKSRDYKSMLKENPDLGTFEAKNVQRAFSTLHRFNPDFAGDPMVAGSFVRRQAQFPEFDTTQLTSLVNARKSLSDLKKLPVPGRVPWESAQENEKGKLELAQLRHSVNVKDPAQADLFRAQAENHRRPVHPAQVKAWKQQTKKTRADSYANRMRDFDEFGGGGDMP